MIGQYLSNKNENATVAKSKNFSELNKAHMKKFLDFDIVVFSFLFNKHCLIMK